MDLMMLGQKCLQGVLRMRGVRSCTEVVAGERVHHYSLEGSGRGPPVVLLHGLGGSANGFAGTFFGLARRFRAVHAVDLPGHGFSPPPGRTVSLRGQLEVFAAWCAAVVREPALVVGNSLGGAMAIQLATEVPAHVRALALISPAGARVEQARLEALLRSFDIRTAAQAREMTERLFHRPPWALRLLSGQMKAFYGTPTVRALVSEALSLAYLAPEVLGGLSVPTLLLWGGSEKLLPFEGLDYFRAHLPPAARVEVVEGFGHVPQVEVPEAVVARLHRFADEAGL